MDIGFHNCVARALLVHVSAEENMRRSLQVPSADERNELFNVNIFTGFLFLFELFF